MYPLPLTTYRQAIEYIYSLKTFGMRQGLKDFKLLLKKLNEPQNKLRLIIVGGTNGKGSTSAMLSAILKESGCRVGLYTSPHLEKFTERIRINDEDILERDIITLCNRIRNTIDKNDSRFYITFFEFVTAIAFIYFLERRVDIAILEVGMGGRLDATNVGRPIVSIITNISREHEAVLGNGLLDIAREKSGIVKKDGILITGVKDPLVLRLLRDVCQEKGAMLRILGRDFYVNIDQCGTFSYRGCNSLKDLHTNLNGMHQCENASLALATIEVLREKGISIEKYAVRNGLKGVSWPGRLEIITTPLNRRVLLDSAHNPAGTETLRNFFLKEISFYRIVLILGIMKDKDIEGIVSILAPVADHIIVTGPEEERSTPLDILSQVVMRYNTRVEVIDKVVEACRYGLSFMEKNDIMCVTGSIFTVGEARKFLYNL